MLCSLGPRLLPRLGVRSRSHIAAAGAAGSSVQMPAAGVLGRRSWAQADRHHQLRAKSFASRFVAASRSFAAQASGEKASEEKPAEEKPAEEKPASDEEKPAEEKPAEENPASDEDMQSQLQERRRKIEEVKRKQQLKSQTRMEEVKRKVDETKRRREEADGSKASASGASSASDSGADATTAEATDAKTAEPAAADAEPTPVDRLQAEFEEFSEKSRAKKHELLLALADFENNKKKFSKERETRRRSATAKFARRMVDVYHEFEAMDAFKLGDKAELSEACTALQEGVALTRNLLGSAMEKGSVERLTIDLGQPVVAARHEVVGSVPGDGNLPTDSIAEVVDAGWALEPRSANSVVLRRAKVKTVGSASEAGSPSAEQ